MNAATFELVNRVACVVTLIVIGGAAVLAAPVIDGRFDPSEGYTSGVELVLNVEGAERGDPLIVALDKGQLWSHCDPDSGDLSIAFIQPVTLVDNSYGDNAIGWPNGHTYKNLKDSDKAQFQIGDAGGNLVLDFELDYLKEDHGTYVSKVEHVETGDEDDVLLHSTSLVYNLSHIAEVSPDDFTVDSPEAGDDYNLTGPNAAAYAAWEFEVIYEVKISGALFEGCGFGEIVLVHDSPNKIGKNKVYPEPGAPITQSEEPIPEPATATVLLLGLIAARRRRTAR